MEGRYQLPGVVGSSDVDHDPRRNSLPRPIPPLLLRGGTLLTLDAGATVLPGADLLIRGGPDRLARALPEPPPGARVLDVSGCLVLPGLIQGHLHLGQTFFRGLAEERRLLAWLRERIWPLEAAHDDESAYWCGLLGAAECLLGGTTTIQDIGIGPGARGLLQAIADSGLRAFAGLCLMDSGDGLPAAMRQETDARARRDRGPGRPLRRRGGRAPALRAQPALHPHLLRPALGGDPRPGPPPRLAGPHPCPGAAGRDARRARAQGRAGRDRVLRRPGRCSRPTSASPTASGSPPSTSTGCAAARFSVVHCPSSNLKLGSGIADLLAFRRAGVPVGIGTDGAACSNQLDNFAELRLAALLQKVKHGPDAFSGLDALRLATSEGARALGLQDEIGTIEPGKRADLVVLAAGRPELWAAPQADPHDLVAFGASRAAVRHVLVDGRLEVEEGRLTRLDLEEIYRRVRALPRGADPEVGSQSLNPLSCQPVARNVHSRAVRVSVEC